MGRPGHPNSPRRAAGLRGTAITVSACAALLAMPPALAAGPPPIPPAAVAARLGANKVPAELVVLVDISASMSWDGLYPVVKRELPRFLQRLMQQDPQDTVSVILFGTRRDTQPVYLGPPTSKIDLPPSATSGATDFGYAFQKALDVLSLAPSRIKVGGVMLLSDGGLNAAGDPEYNGYDASGWQKLHVRARSLGMTVTGYGLPLTSDQATISSVGRALKTVFPQVQLLAANLVDLGQELSLAQQKIRNRRVASAVKPDIGRGVRISWSSLPGNGGAGSLNLGAGWADAQVRLTATTKRVPLNVSGLSVSTSGFPVAITGSVAGGNRTLSPGQSVTLPVHLAWHQVTGGSSLLGSSTPVHGRLTLTGHVTSQFTPAIRGAFDDRTFAVGGLTGAVSTPVLATIPTQADTGVWLLLVLLVLVAAAALYGLCARLGGRLILSPPGQNSRALILPRWPWVSRPTDDLIHTPGRITVRGTVRRRRMRIRLQLDGVTSTGVLKPSGRTMIAGIDVIHDPVMEPVADNWPEFL